MKKSIKTMRNALYLLLPLCFFALVHLLFAYGNWEMNPKNWSNEIRSLSAFFGLIAMGVGIGLAFAINEE